MTAPSVGAAKAKPPDLVADRPEVASAMLDQERQTGVGAQRTPGRHDVDLAEGAEREENRPGRVEDYDVVPLLVMRRPGGAQRISVGLAHG